MKRFVTIFSMLLLSVLPAISPLLRSQSDEAGIGLLAEDRASLEIVLDLLRSEGAGAINLDELAALKLRLANRPIPDGRDVQGRADLALAWKLLAAVDHQLEGDTPDVLESLRIAHNLNPEDREVTRELNHIQRKIDAVQERLDEAARLREATARGN